VFVFALFSFKHLNSATNAFEEPLNGAETKTGKTIPMLYYNSPDFTLASSIYDPKELAAVVV
jgi:hypothetical protein